MSGEVEQDYREKGSEVTVQASDTNQVYATSDPYPAQTAKRFAWLNSYTITIFFKRLASFLIFLSTLAIIACSIYVSVIAYPAIAAALSSALMLSGLPYGIFTLIGLLPLLVSIAVLLRFMQIHWQLEFERFRGDSLWDKIKNIFRGITTEFTLEYVEELFSKAFLTFFNTEHPAMDVSTKKQLQMTSKMFNIETWLIASGIGIFLTVKLVPSLLAAVVSLGVPFPVAVLFGAAAAATLTVIIYQLHALIMHLANAGIYSYFHHRHWRHPRVFLPSAGAVVGMGLAITASTVFYPALVSTLSTMLTTSMAGFTAVALCVSFTLAMIFLVGNIGAFLAAPRLFLRGEKLNLPHHAEEENDSYGLNSRHGAGYGRANSNYGNSHIPADAFRAKTVVAPRQLPSGPRRLAATDRADSDVSSDVHDNPLNLHG